jgi:hypothetical protein
MKILFCAVIILLCNWHLGQSAETVIWSGESGGFSIHWTDQDISVHPAKDPSKVIFSTKLIAEKDTKAWFEAQKQFDDEEMNTEKDCEFGPNYRLFSVVGSILTIEYSESAVCSFAAHPDLQLRLISFVLSKNGDVIFSTAEIDHADRSKEVFLTDFFPEKEILEALLQDKMIKKELQERKASTPSSLLELQTKLSEDFHNLIDTENCGYDFPKDFLSRFVFYDIEGKNVIVRIALPSGVGACQSHQLMLPIRLNIPERLNSDLTNAALKKQGFLMKDLVKLGKAAQSDFTYEISDESYE